MGQRLTGGTVKMRPVTNFSECRCASRRIARYVFAPWRRWEFGDVIVDARQQAGEGGLGVGSGSSSAFSVFFGV
jgi:hypothetical protein